MSMWFKEEIQVLLWNSNWEILCKTVSEPNNGVEEGEKEFEKRNIE
jgi:hypothetical protein